METDMCDTVSDRAPARPTNALPLDLDDVTRCPVAALCEGCGRADTRRQVVTVQTRAGVMCRTLCADCARTDRIPRVHDWAEAVTLINSHCAHLGIDPFQMALALRRAALAG